MKLHHTDDGPVLLLAGSLGSTVAMGEPQLTLAGPGAARGAPGHDRER